MKLAIIIPTKNEEKTLPYLINSIKEQNFKDWKIIVANHPDSNDKTEEIAKIYGCEIVKGGMPSEGRNNGAKKAIQEGFEILVFIDADVILPDKYFLKNSLDEFKKRKLDLAGTLQVPWDISKRINSKEIKKSRDLRYRLVYNISNFFLKVNQYTKNPFMQNCMFVKREVHETIGGFKLLEFGEDSEYVKKAVKKGYKFKILKCPEKVFISPRRFKQKGFLKMVKEYIYFDIKLLMGYEFIFGKSRKYFD